MNRAYRNVLDRLEDTNFPCIEIDKCEGSMTFELFYDDELHIEGDGTVHGRWWSTPETYDNPGECGFDFKGCRVNHLTIEAYDEDADDWVCIPSDEAEEFRRQLEEDLADFLSA